MLLIKKKQNKCVSWELLMIKTIKKYAFAFLALSFLLAPVFSQEFEESQNQEVMPDALPQELQQNFIIVEAVRQHELNPQITNYSSDSQILNGLYEGLFTLSPVSLEPQYAIAKEFKISRDKKRWSITLRDDAFSVTEKK